MKKTLLTIRFFFIASFINIYKSKVLAEDIGFDHSRDYIFIEDEGDWEKLIQTWKTRAVNDFKNGYRIKRNAYTKNKVPKLEEIEKFIKTFEPAFKFAQKTIKDIVKSSAVLTGRLKTAYSIQGKLEKSGTTLESLYDIIGLRLTCQTVSDSNQITNVIEKDTTNFEVIEKKCSGMCPGAKKYREGGYRRIHLILRLKPDNKTAELQIGTPFTNYWADWSHDFIYKGPEVITNQTTVKNYSLFLADYFLKLDEDRNHMPKCPEILEKSNALDILKKTLPEKDALKMFNKVNEPSNACYWWYDMRLALPEKASGKSETSFKNRRSLDLNRLQHDLETNCGHTRDYILIDDSPNLWDNLMSDWHKKTQSIRFKRSSFTITKLPTLDEIEKFIQTFKPAFESLQKSIKDIVKNNAILTGRLKEANSILGKLEKDNTRLQDLNDTIGLRLTCQTVDESLRIVDKIKKNKKNFEILNEKCYGMCPNAGKYKEGGYRRIHLILRLIPESKMAELQVGTPYTNYWSDWNHDFIYKGPPEINNSSDVNRYSLALADYFLTSDSSRSILPLCPTFLQNANALDILKSSLPLPDAEKMFKKIGEPPNGCFWWYDMKLGQTEPDTKPTSPSGSSASSLRFNLFTIILCIEILFTMF
ncbi:uncharacterized protein LOC124819218 [Hydra vulgaris]|uniref:Uncharacterized protein LOC124819218 n=1 Tax=Hydra vulgaris TaxID=6087 RepID=A0ABM4DIJ8_HYDVU